MTRPTTDLAASHSLVDTFQQELDPLSLGAERFRPIDPEDDASRRIRLLRSERRIRTQIRALLYAGRSFQTTTISDLSRSGAGINGATGVVPGDLVALQLLDGRAIPGQVRWWLGGRCGIAFLEPLKDLETIVDGPHNRLRGSGRERSSVPHVTREHAAGGMALHEPAGAAAGGTATASSPYRIATEEALANRLRERYLRRYSGA